jgi:GNAT superfamily N-acetyltransferase
VSGLKWVALACVAVGWGACGDTRLMIRPGTPADYPAVAAIFRSASLSNDSDRENLLANPQHLIVDPAGLDQGRTYVAQEGESIVGFASWIEAEGNVDLDDLFVDPTWMRRGIATALVLHIVDVLRGHGVSRLEVTANPNALDFYRAVGFRDIGVARTEFGTAPRMALMID